MSRMLLMSWDVSLWSRDAHKTQKPETRNIFLYFFSFYNDANFMVQSCKLSLKLVVCTFIAFSIVKLHV